MNATRVLGALLVVVGLGWFLAVPAILPAAYHGYVHTGHEHAQYAATPVDPDVQGTGTIVEASVNAADAAPSRNWTAARNTSLLPASQGAFAEARAGDANATTIWTRSTYRGLASRHPYVENHGTWYELTIEDAENYTILQAARVDTGTVTTAVAVTPSALPEPAATQTRTLARADGATLLSRPAVSTPLYVEQGGQIHLVARVGDAPAPPPLPALVLFLTPGVVLALVGAYLGVRR